ARQVHSCAGPVSDCTAEVCDRDLHASPDGTSDRVGSCVVRNDLDGTPCPDTDGDPSTFAGCRNGVCDQAFLRGPAGSNGAVGPTGPPGPAGARGPTGPTGSQGVAGLAGPLGRGGPKGDKGNNGQHGKGFRKMVVPPNDPNYPAECHQGAAQLIYNQHFDDASSSWVDDPLVDGTNPSVICHGKDGAP